MKRVVFVFLLLFIWIRPGIVLWKLQGGKTMYFIHLILGFIPLFFFIKLIAGREPMSYDILTNLGNNFTWILCLLIWTFWGIALNVYAEKKKRDTK